MRQFLARETTIEYMQTEMPLLSGIQFHTLKNIIKNIENPRT